MLNVDQVSVAFNVIARVSRDTERKSSHGGRIVTDRLMRL